MIELPFVWFGESKPLVESLRKIKLIDNKAKIIQGHGEVCSAKKIDEDIGYIENVAQITQEYLDSERSEEDAESGIKLEQCLPKERLETMPEVWARLHPMNTVRIYRELNEQRKKI